MYFLSNMGIFQPAMLVYQRVYFLQGWHHFFFRWGLFKNPPWYSLRLLRFFQLIRVWSIVESLNVVSWVKGTYLSGSRGWTHHPQEGHQSQNYQSKRINPPKVWYLDPKNIPKTPNLRRYLDVLGYYLENIISHVSSDILHPNGDHGMSKPSAEGKTLCWNWTIKIIPCGQLPRGRSVDVSWFVGHIFRNFTSP